MEMITFSCPNGHQYTVPASFAGKKTTCKACGVPFSIPRQRRPPEPPPVDILPADADEVPEAVPVPIDESSAGFLSSPSFQGPPQAFQGPPVFPVAPAAAAADPFPPSTAFGSVAYAQPSEDPGVTRPPAAQAGGLAFGQPGLDFDQIHNGIARLVARLWAERGHGGIVELHLTSGGPICPDFYDPALSDGTHGLFANHLPDGTVTLTAVRWDAVQKVIVRKVEGLPDGMFEAFET